MISCRRAADAGVVQEEAKADETLNGLWASIEADEDVAGGNGREKTKVLEPEVAGVVKLEGVFEVEVEYEVEIGDAIVVILLICEL